MAEDVMTYKIELRYFSGWDDAEWTEADDESERPLRFADRIAAQSALAAFFDDVSAAVRAGNMDVNESAADYRIVEAID